MDVTTLLCTWGLWASTVELTGPTVTASPHVGPSDKFLYILSFKYQGFVNSGPILCHAYTPRKSRNGGGFVISPRLMEMDQARWLLGNLGSPRTYFAALRKNWHGALRAGSALRLLGSSFCEVMVKADFDLLWSLSPVPLGKKHASPAQGFIPRASAGKANLWVTLRGKTSDVNTAEVDAFSQVSGKGQDLWEFSRGLPL